MILSSSFFLTVQFEPENQFWELNHTPNLLSVRDLQLRLSKAASG
jgi:hypothetical protein